MRLNEWLKRLARVNQVSGKRGVRALLVHAIHDRAKQFYEHDGFQVSPVNPVTLMLRLSAVVA